MKKKLMIWFERLSVAAIALIACLTLAISSTASAVVIANFDYNGDGDLSIADAVILARVLALDSSVDNFNRLDPNGDGVIDALDMVAVLQALAGIDPNPPEQITTTTTVTETTTTVTETTTVADTTTQTTTYLAIDNEYFTNMVIKSDCIWDRDNRLYDGDLYEAEGVHFFRVGDDVWCYSFLSEMELTDFQLIAQPEHISALHIWMPYQSTVRKYLTKWGIENVADVSDPFPEPDPPYWVGENGSMTSYNLTKWSEITVFGLERVSNNVAGNRNVNILDIAWYDYNLSQSIDREDLTIMMRYYFAKLPSEFYGIEYVNVDHINYVYNVETGIFHVYM